MESFCLESDEAVRRGRGLVALRLAGAPSSEGPSRPGPKEAHWFAHFYSCFSAAGASCWLRPVVRRWSELTEDAAYQGQHSAQTTHLAALFASAFSGAFCWWHHCTEAVGATRRRLCHGSSGSGLDRSSARPRETGGRELLSPLPPLLYRLFHLPEAKRGSGVKFGNGKREKAVLLHHPKVFFFYRRSYGGVGGRWSPLLVS